MEADWHEITRILLPPPVPNAPHTPVSALAFDTSQELLWTGNEYGRVTSLYGSELQRYTSCRAHPANEGPVKQILLCDKGVLSISAKSVHLCSSVGLTQWHITNQDMTDLRCMSFCSKGTGEILVAGCQPHMFRIDVEKGTVTETHNAEAAYTLMRRGGQYICAAAADGNIHILDSAAFKLVRSWKAHSGWINDMDVRSDILVTCGWSPRQQHGYMLDHLANVFDLKNMMPLPPIPFPPGAAFVRMHPRMSTTCIVASQTGLIYAVDILNPDSPSMKHANIFDTHLLALDLAASGEALALTDAQCAVHLWGSPTKVQFNEYSIPTIFADEVQPAPAMDWSPEIPLNIVGMPFYRDALLSAWPSHLIAEIGAPPVRVDPKIMATAKRSDLGAYAPWPRKTRRYQFEDTRAMQRAQDTLAAPKFLSEKARGREDTTNANGDRRISDALEVLADMANDSTSRKEVPLIYRNVEIRYSKFGVDDFDFEYFNKTKHSGLETHIANSYTNSLLQLFRFIPVLRNLALHHTATACLYDNCLLCELGFLTDMLEKAGGMNCQASNLLKVFQNSPDAASHGLLEEQAYSNPLSAMIQAVNRFFLRSFVDSFKKLPPHFLHMDQALTTGANLAIRCNHCANEMHKPGSTPVHDFVYPPKSIKHHPRAARPSFSQILKSSVERQEQIRGWCDRCKRYQQLSTRKTIQTIPKVLMINAAIHSLDQRQFWSTPNWLPREIGVIVTGGQFYCYEGQDLRLHLQRGVYDITVYELVGLVADIQGGDNHPSHLVSLINVSPSVRDSEETQSWHLFNDFLVRQVASEDALQFDSAWKLPSVLAYQIKTASKKIDDTWKDNLDPTLLYHLPRGIHKQQPPATVLRPLDEVTETPTASAPMAIDAEFVALSKAEIDVKADGTKETIRPPRLGLARVSVLRGAGTDPGLPFIDDYISVSEPVVDYLTAYSGIHPGDLDRSTSKHNLVSLKAAYKKLWILLNLGVVFVGHGLPKDFRTINIHVPRAQVVDTVDLFSLGSRSQRRLSLRFLAWFLLKEDIQDGVAGHDSVEDARTALKLWERWKELDAAGVLEQTMEEIWDKGREMGFKVPGQWKQEQQLGAGDGEGVATPGVASMPGTPRRGAAGLSGQVRLAQSPFR